MISGHKTGRYSPCMVYTAACHAICHAARQRKSLLCRCAIIECLRENRLDCEICLVGHMHAFSHDSRLPSGHDLLRHDSRQGGDAVGYAGMNCMKDQASEQRTQNDHYWVMAISLTEQAVVREGRAICNCKPPGRRLLLNSFLAVNPVTLFRGLVIRFIRYSAL